MHVPGISRRDQESHARIRYLMHGRTLSLILFVGNARSDGLDAETEALRTPPAPARPTAAIGWVFPAKMQDFEGPKP
jgi:hypothetical protein